MFNQITVESNGFIAVENVVSQHSNKPLPSEDARSGIIVGFWDDLNPSSAETSRIYFQDFGHYAVFQYDAVHYYSGSGTVTFQIVLFESGEIRFYYKEISGTRNYATIGMQNSTRDEGLQVVHNSDYIKDIHAISITNTSDWISIAPESGTIASGETHFIDVTFDATGKEVGTYESFLSIESNDPENPVVDVPLTLHVTGFTNIALSDETLDFGYAILSEEPTLPITITNTGDATLVIYDIEFSSSEFFTNVTQLIINAGESQDLMISFYSDESGTYNSQLSFSANVVGQESITIPLSADVVTYDLVLNATPAEGGFVEGSGKYQEGDQATITAIGNEGWEFINWTGDTEYIDDVESAGTVMTFPARNVNITANFIRKTTLIKDTDHLEFSVYPNPGSEKFTIESSVIIKKIQLIDVGGRVVKDIVVNELQTELNVSNLPSGLYFIQISTAEKIITERVQIIR